MSDIVDHFVAASLENDLLEFVVVGIVCVAMHNGRTKGAGCTVEVGVKLLSELEVGTRRTVIPRSIKEIDLKVLRSDVTGVGKKYG